MLEKIRNYITENNLIEHGDKIVAGISGGADSVCLLVLLASIKEEFGLEITAVHVNHGLRGAYADNDEEYTKRLCADYNIECVIYKADIKKTASDEGLSEEEAGRKVRYELFNTVLKERGCNKIAVAHHINDNAETVLFNIFRGTGIKGACGIKPLSGNIIRPLLCLKRNEIESFLREKNISWCTDLTNFEEDYSRNMIRHSILGYAAENINSEAAAHVNDFSIRLSKMYSFVLNAAGEAFEKVCIKSSKERTELDLKEYLSLDEVIAAEVIRMAFNKADISLKDIGAVHYEAVRGIAKGGSGKHTRLPGGVIILNSGGRLIIYIEDESRRTAKAAENITNSTDGEITDSEAGGIIRLGSLENFKNNPERIILPDNTEITVSLCEYNGEEYPCSTGEAWFSADALSGELFLRTRHENDKIVINENGSKKSIKSLFIDKKIPSCDRQKIYMLVCENEILWVFGVRKSEGRRISNTTKTVLKVRCNRDKI